MQENGASSDSCSFREVRWSSESDRETEKGANNTLSNEKKRIYHTKRNLEVQSLSRNKNEKSSEGMYFQSLCCKISTKNQTENEDFPKYMSKKNPQDIL